MPETPDKRAALRDLRRLIAPLDILYAIGNIIYRRSLRYTLFTAGIGVLGLVAKQFSLPGFTVRQALLLPLVVGAGSLLIGGALKIVPSLISSRLQTVAQASDLNLMEDYRKSEMADHLTVLWARVFRHEVALRRTTGEPAFEGRPSDHTASAEARDDRTEFFARATRALNTPQPQVRQVFECGLDLRYLEDWRDGAYFDRSDTKLAEQFAGAATLSHARSAAGAGGIGAVLSRKADLAVQRLWFLFVMRGVALPVADAVVKLNRQYATDIFNSQVLLWPGEEAAAWIACYDGAADRVTDLRRRVVRRIFGADFSTACRLIDRMFGASFRAATDLRMRFDPEYCDGDLGYSILDDLATESCAKSALPIARDFIASRRESLAHCEDILRDLQPDLFAPENAAAWRAVRLALHMDYRGIRRRVLDRGDFAGRVDAAIDQHEQWSRSLVAVRIHHELTRLHLFGYRRLVHRLAYADEPFDVPDPLADARRVDDGVTPSPQSEQQETPSDA